MGAPFVSDHTHLEWVLFFAILLHKAPTAFGLSTFLLQKGLPRERVLRHLTVFCASTPISAITTYLLIGGGDSHLLQFRTGLLLLFSAGTFVYVATVHILPEITSNSLHRKLSKMQVFLLLLGMLTSVLLTIDV
jgi:solute carrier family 39 (zinc transporter), member 9